MSVAAGNASAMAGKKPCFRCGRQIDDWARICPFCNSDQTVRTEAAVQHETPSIELPVRRKRNPSDFFRTVPGRVAIGLGIVLLLGGTFAIGTIVYSLGSASETGEVDEAPASPAPLGARTEAVDGSPGGLVLVPTGAAVTSFEQSPQQSQPAAEGSGDEGLVESLRRDATALSAEVYARMARAERVLQQRREQEIQNQTTDPRAIKAPPAWAAGQRRPPDQPPREQAPPTGTTTQPPGEADESRAARRTPPVPVSQPIPALDSVQVSGTVRLNLTIDSSGRVREVEIVQSVPGITAKLVGAVRRWRFRPATEDGKPVQGMFPVEVSFNASDD